MISYLDGTIISKKDKFVVLLVGGVGYKVFLSKKSLSNLPEIGQSLKLNCFLSVREDSLSLYGFLSQEELDLFEALESIRGIGPKASLEISSIGSVHALKERIDARDGKVFEGIPGIGEKKAMAIILDMTGKIGGKPEKNIINNKEKLQAEDGLVRLGFGRQEARSALENLSHEIKNADQMIKEVFKILGRNNQFKK
jgi:holliday junction DNA helicase RuvA